MPKRKAAAAAGSSSADVSESAKKATRASERLAKKAKVKAEGAIVQVGRVKRESVVIVFLTHYSSDTLAIHSTPT